MNYEWDSAKNLENIKKHKISFEQSIPAIEDPHRLFLYDEDTIRIISARTANKKEQEAYYGYCALYFGNRP